MNFPNQELIFPIILTPHECHLKGVASSDEPKENYQLALQLLRALWGFIASLSSLFSCSASNFTVLLHSHSFYKFVLYFQSQ